VALYAHVSDGDRESLDLWKVDFVFRMKQHHNPARQSGKYGLVEPASG
jgi:hypothetical protein